MYCIYKITNKINGKFYIGQHKYSDENNPMGYYKGSGFLLHKAYDKYGIENFDTEVIYKRIRDKETVDSMEKYCIKTLKPEYNLHEGGTGGSMPDCVRKKMSESVKNRKDSPHAHQIYKRKTWIQDCWDFYTKYYCSQYYLGYYKNKRIESEEVRKGKSERSKKMWERLKTEGYKAKSHKGNKNFRHTEETKKRISESMKLYRAKSK